MTSCFDFLGGFSGEDQGCGGAVRNGEAVCYGAVLFPCPTTFYASEGAVIVAACEGHLACGVGYGAQLEVFPSGLFGVALNAQAAVYHPLAHGAEGIVVEGVHGVVASESVGVRIGVEAFPDGCGALGDGIEP